MAADPGSSGVGGDPYHLFLTRIPPKLPKEEVEAALSSELASRNVKVLAISVVPQSAWKNKGFGFVVLNGSPSAVEVEAIAAELDNCISIGGKIVNVRVCQASVSGGKPAVTPGPLASWDQPVEKITRLCAQVLHCYFARRTHQEAYKAEKLLALLSMSVAPSCCQEPKPVSLWGRKVYGSLEKMLLAIGDSHFGGDWALNGTIADRNAMLTIGKARHMQGWDSLRDPLPIATLLRLAACKQRLEGINTPDISSGLSTPTACRRFSDCGSLSAMHSTEQPSCSHSEASWSLGSLYTAPATTGEHTGSDCSPSLCTPSNDTEGTALSSTTSTTPESWESCKSLEGCGGSGGGRGSGTTGDRQGGAASTSQPPHPLPGAAAGKEAAGHPTGSSRPPAAGHPTGGADANCSAGNTPPKCCTATCAGAAGARPTPACRGGGGGASAASAPRPRHRTPRSVHYSSSVANSAAVAGGSQHAAHGPPTPPGGAPPALAQAGCTRVYGGGGGEDAAQPPSSRDLLARCARRLISLFRRQPSQISYAVADVESYLSEAQEVVAWGRDAPYFSLKGYACAVYGSFESFLLEIARLHFNDSWCFAGGHRPGEPRIMFRTRRLTLAGGLLGAQ